MTKKQTTTAAAAETPFTPGNDILIKPLPGKFCITCEGYFTEAVGDVCPVCDGALQPIFDQAAIDLLAFALEDRDQEIALLKAELAAVPASGEARGVAWIDMYKIVTLEGGEHRQIKKGLTARSYVSTEAADRMLTVAIQTAMKNGWTTYH